MFYFAGDIITRYFALKKMGQVNAETLPLSTESIGNFLKKTQGSFLRNFCHSEMGARKITALRAHAVHVGETEEEKRRRVIKETK